MEDGSGMTPQDFVDTAAEGNVFFEIIQRERLKTGFFDRWRILRAVGAHEELLTLFKKDH